MCTRSYLDRSSQRGKAKNRAGYIDNPCLWRQRAFYRHACLAWLLGRVPLPVCAPRSICAPPRLFNRTRQGRPNPKLDYQVGRRGRGASQCAEVAPHTLWMAGESRQPAAARTRKRLCAGAFQAHRLGSAHSSSGCVWKRHRSAAAPGSAKQRWVHLRWGGGGACPGLKANQRI